VHSTSRVLANRSWQIFRFSLSMTQLSASSSVRVVQSVPASLIPVLDVAPLQVIRVPQFVEPIVTGQGGPAQAEKHRSRPQREFRPFLMTHANLPFHIAPGLPVESFLISRQPSMARDDRNAVGAPPPLDTGHFA
jgi:hypothetical protein